MDSETNSSKSGGNLQRFSRLQRGWSFHTKKCNNVISVGNKNYAVLGLPASVPLIFVRKIIKLFFMHKSQPVINKNKKITTSAW